MSSSTFSDQLKSSLSSLCQLFKSCQQHYALHCHTDGHLSQLIFAVDLACTYRSSSSTISAILIDHLILFEKELGTHVKVLTYFLRDFIFDRIYTDLNIYQRRIFLLNIFEKFSTIEFQTKNEEHIWTKENVNIELLIGYILDTLPRVIFDRKNLYHQHLTNLIKHNLNRIDDYLIYHQQLSLITTGSSIEQSRLLDGILIPIHNSKKLLPILTSNCSISIVFLNLQSTEFEQLITIHDSNQEFLSYETFIYRQFIEKYLSNINLLISTICINEYFLFELHQANINVLDSIDEQTFEFLLKVYRCLPCNRLLLSENESIDSISTMILDRHVQINQQTYIYLSSNGSYQTLLTCLPTSTLIHTTEKILINSIRLVKFIFEQFNKTSRLQLATEDEYLRFVSYSIPELRSILDYRRIYLSKHSNNLLYPICLYQKYLSNGIDFLCYINKIDGVYNATRKTV